VCGAPTQEETLDRTLPASVDPATASIIQGRVVRGGEPVAAAYVRLLDATGEFTAEVVSSATGVFRFFAVPGRWTLRALAPGARGQQDVQAGVGFTETRVEIG
jgi:hypothetical protein